MNTQTHMLMGAALFGSTISGSETAAAVLGGLLPDLPAIALVMWARSVKHRSMGEIFSTLYVSQAWQAMLAPWHSLPLWGLALAAAWLTGSGVAFAFAASGFLHIGIDFFVHAQDAHRQFWPISDWRYRSPVSYWDPAHYGRLFRPFEALLAIGFTLALMTRYPAPWVIVALGLLLALYAAQMLHVIWTIRRAPAG